MCVSISVVIPAYNEAARLPPYLAKIRTYFADCAPGSYEVIVVDDGSTDDLGVVVTRLAADWPELCLLSLDCNRGKGAAVRAGMLRARGQLLLFTDADGATPIEEEQHLRTALACGAELAIGSRLFQAAEPSLNHRLWHRGLAGRSFAWLARQLLPLPVLDTQCGFKMFCREVGQTLFRLCREPGYLFDLEVLVRAQQLGYRVAEVPVCWRDVPGSKIRLLRDGWKMVRGLWALRCRLRAGELSVAQGGSGTVGVLSEQPDLAGRERDAVAAQDGIPTPPSPRPW